MTPHKQKELELTRVDEVAILPESLDEGKKRDFPESLIIIAKHKRLIGYFVLGATVLSAVISLLWPKSYTATARILPPQQNQSIAATMLNQLGGLAPLLNGGGGSLGLRNPNDMYVGMLRSRTVAENLINKFKLLEVYRVNLREDAWKTLEAKTEIAAGKDGIISVSVEDHDPSRAADIANAYLSELENLTKTLAVTDAGKRRIFFEREVKTANDDLAKAEQALKQTEEKTGMIQLDSQARVMLQAYADLRAAVTAKEVEIQAMRSFATAENPDLVRAEHELAALRTQVANYEQGQGGRPIGDIALEKVPSRALEYLRKYREVKYREALMEMMLKQYEIARIDESKDSSLVQILDPSKPPERRSWPKRTAIVLATVILAMMISIVAALVLEKVQRMREDPQFSAQFQLFKFYLWHKQKS